ncbi:MAG: circularly permuted type 2 ATP-grasp protein [Spirochaetales bacterium]|nr:circularly permuted type 2 ATP-grasp protein [Spirochaetales bacterium]
MTALHVDGYEVGSFYDEMFHSSGDVREFCRPLLDEIRQLPLATLLSRKDAIEKAMFRMGITFSVYKDGKTQERIFPFDILPRIIAAREWQTLEAGLKQRIRALNSFIADIYNEKRILKEKIIPTEIIESASGYLKPCQGLRPPLDVWCHIAGTDLIRHGDGQYYVLEDNLRCPSGVSYVLENREHMKRTFPDLFRAMGVAPVYDYAQHLLATLKSLTEIADPTIAVLSPGVFNSAYFEHVYLARQMGVQLVEGSDLLVQSNQVFMKTTAGPEPVHVIYRRIDDTFLDPLSFRPDSMLGVPGIFSAFRAGNVALANAPGTGVADDKVIYSYVPDMIRFYLDQEALLPNVPTYLCWRDADRQHVLGHLSELVVKAANEAGGYGMLIGPASTKSEQEEFARKIQANPRNYIAQPVMALSRVPILLEDHLEGRHVDLRPFILSGKDIYVMPGGLTRVALVKGSLVVNSSQGGGSKDTWVLQQ